MSSSTLSRRDFLKNTGILSGGLLIGLNFQSCGIAKAAYADSQFNDWIRVANNGDVFLVSSRSEMGQGIKTSIVSILADEMEADWQYVHIEQAIGDKKYGDQNTDGSKSVTSFYMTLRKAGAAIKSLMISAAAIDLKVPESELRADSHYVIHDKSGDKVFYGDLVKTAMTLDVPTEGPLKDPKDFKYIGKRQKNVIVKDIVVGKGTFGIDKTLPNMVYASIQRSPVFGGTVKSYNADAALKIKGVNKVLEIKRYEGLKFPPLGGVAVIANNSWVAEQGKLALEIEWDDGPNKDYNSDQYMQSLSKSVQKKGRQIRKEGDVYREFNRSKSIDAEYRAAHLVHAPMEAPNAVAHVQADKIEIWAPVQNPQDVQNDVVKATGMKPEQVICNVTLLGGGFGRKSKCDFVMEAVHLSKELGLPVKVTWSREDDIRHSFYHTVSCQYLKGSLKSGKISAWLHRTAFPTIMSTFVPGAKDAAGWEFPSLAIPYEVPNIQFENAPAANHVRIGWLRSVCSIFQSFATNSFMDELAHAAKKDPLEFYLESIGSDRNIILNERQKESPYQFSTKRLEECTYLQPLKMPDWGKNLPAE